MISAAIKPFIYRQVVRSCSTNSVSYCCKDSKWLCTFGFSELRDRSKTEIHLMCFKSNSEKQKKKKKKKVRFSSEFRWQLSNRWNSSNWFTVAALNKKKTFYTADHFYEKVQREAPVRNSFWKRSVKQKTVDWEVFQFHSFKENLTC